MNQNIKRNIITRLHEIERENDVEILYAIESGSRAWGFESIDSDYDVRFIYRHGLEWYLNVLPRRDVIEYPVTGDYDFSGWDLRKTFFLMNRSNPVLYEWLRSPIVYMKNEKAYELMLDASRRYFSPLSTMYHYLHMAKRNNRDFLQGENVKVKKYFYVLRPLLACMWIQKNTTPPPVEFEQLLAVADIQGELMNDLLQLLQRKKSGVELGIERKIPSVDAFINKTIAYFEKNTGRYDPARKPSADYLDEKFIEILKL